MENYFEKNDLLAEKYIKDPYALTLNDLLADTGAPNFKSTSPFWLNSYFWKTKPKEKVDDGIREIGNFKIQLELIFGIPTNSRKNNNYTPKQKIYHALDNTTGKNYELHQGTGFGGSVEFAFNRRSNGR